MFFCKTRTTIHKYSSHRHTSRIAFLVKKKNKINIRVLMRKKSRFGANVQLCNFRTTAKFKPRPHCTKRSMNRVNVKQKCAWQMIVSHVVIMKFFSVNAALHCVYNKKKDYYSNKFRSNGDLEYLMMIASRVTIVRVGCKFLHFTWERKKVGVGNTFSISWRCE